MATIVIPEQIVNTVKPVGNYLADALIEANWPEQLPTLLITFNGDKYTVKCTYWSEEKWYYGEEDDKGSPVFTTYPFYICKNVQFGGLLKTENPGEYIINAVVAEENPAPKVLSFPKGRTIVSELSRLNKAFGTISKKKTIIGQLSDIADAAEAGKIGGGSGGAFMVHVSEPAPNNLVMDKTWQEIYDALKTTSVYVIVENYEALPRPDPNMSLVAISLVTIRIIAAGVNNGIYWVRSENPDSDADFETNSSDGYPTIVE